MKYSQVKNPKWANSKHTIIDCEVDFDELPYDFVPFTAVAEGDLPHTHEIFARCLAGHFGAIQEYVPVPNLTGSEATDRLREERNNVLSSEVDPIVSNPLRWADMSDEKKNEWTLYRNQLLELPQTQSPVYVWDEDYLTYKLTNVNWPVKPA